MVWSWSHTEEGMENVRQNIRGLPIDTLQETLEEIINYKITYAQKYIKAKILEENMPSDICNDDFYDACLEEDIHSSELVERLVESHKESIEEYTDLSELIYNFAEEQSICENGGFHAWVCPYGCHTVSFSKKENEDA